MALTRRFPPLLAALGALSGCATGSSLSLSQAPLSYVVTEDGGYEVAAGNDGTAQALAENGSFEHGVPGYQAVGGNAILPVPVGVPVTLATNVAGVATLSAVTAPGQMSLDVGAPNTSLGVAVAVRAPVVGVAVQVAPPVIAAATQPLTTLGPVLGATTRPIAPVAASANNAILAAVAAALARRCC